MVLNQSGVYKMRLTGQRQIVTTLRAGPGAGRGERYTRVFVKNLENYAFFALFVFTSTHYFC